MSSPDYELHISSDRFNSLWDADEDAEAFPFSEDTDEIDRIIEEEIGTKPGKPRRKRFR
jgi:hypothetical protein